MALALEVEDGVHDVLERLRSREASVLGDVAHQKCRHVLALGRKQQLSGGLANLTNAARRRLELERQYRLDGVDDHEGRLDARDLLEDALQAGFRQQMQRRIAD